MSARDYKYFTAEIALPVFYIPGSKNQGFLMSALLNPDRHILTLQTRIEPDYKYGLYNMGNPLLPVQTHAAEQWKERCGPSVVGRVSIPNIPLEPLLKVISSSKKSITLLSWAYITQLKIRSKVHNNIRKVDLIPIEKL